MGAIRVNFRNGTSTFLNFDTLVSAFVESAEMDFTRLRGEDISGGNTDYNIIRFIAGQSNVVWPKAMKVAYEAISADPIEYGYPNLGTTWQDYLKWDVAKFADSAIAQALDGDQSMNVVYSERTAIATQVASEQDAEGLLEAIDKFKAEADQIFTEVNGACLDETSIGNNFDCSPEGGIVEPLNGGVNTAGCDACAQAKKEAILKLIGAAVGTIEWKHQYLFEQIGGGEA